MADSAADIYADYVKSLVDAETARKTSLEQRGVGVVTTSGTLVTLLFALIGVLTAAENFSLPTPATSESSFPFSGLMPNPRSMVREFG